MSISEKNWIVTVYGTMDVYCELMVLLLFMKALHICLEEHSPLQYGELWLISMEGNQLLY